MKHEPAFPAMHFDLADNEHGLTMRDYFAAKAMHNFADQVSSQSDQEWFDKVARGAYRMADTMLKVRQE